MNNNSNEQYEQLSKLSSSFREEPSFRRIKKVIFSNSIMSFIVARHNRFKKHEIGREITRRSIEKLQTDLLQDSSTTNFGYQNEGEELKTALAYKKEIEDDFPRLGESKQLYQHAEVILTELLNNSKYFVNFGACFAYIDSIMASKFPDNFIFSVDRSEYTKVLNDSYFSHLTNMTSVADDILNFLGEHKFQNGVFFHARTCCLLPTPYIESLYKAVSKAGFSKIVCMEQIGISRETKMPYRFSDNDQPSVAYRLAMYIHNYPGILNKAGFKVTRAELLRTEHPHEDFRILSITASRDRS